MDRNMKDMHEKNTKSKKFTTKMQRTLLLLFCGIILLMTVLIIVLVKINHEEGERYTKRVLNQQTYVSSTLPYKRGDIVDRNGTVLATSVKVYNLILDMKLLIDNEKYLDPSLEAIYEFFGDKVEGLTLDVLNEYKITKADSSYVVLAKEIDEEEVDKFEEYLKNKENKEEVKGIWFEEEYKRTYPYNSLASSLIGFTTKGDVGNWGIEQYYDDELNGTNGLSYGYFDSNLELIRTVKNAEDGNTIVTTLDANVQQIVEKKINEFIEANPAKSVNVIIMNPNNGEIYAMSSNVQYDLNNPRDLYGFYTESEVENMTSEEKLNALYHIWRNSIISDSFEPGSTFKPFTVASALEENIISYDDTFYCDGYEVAGGWTIRCSKRSGHGLLTLSEALEHSCNDAMMQIVEKLGSSLFWNYQNSFLFGTKTNIDLPGEDIGIIPDVDYLNAAELATSSFGQTFQVTMIQLAAAFSSLVNGGYYYEPHIMKQVEGSTGALVKKNEGVLVKETVTEEDSDFMKQALYLTVEQGTAQGAKVEGYAIGGKTGTAQKYPRADGKFVLSFIGAAPIDDPEVIIYVTIDELDNEVRKSDSSVATKFAGEILEEILPFLGVYPSGNIDYSVFGVEPANEDEEEKKENLDNPEDLPEDYEPVVNDPLTDEYNGDAIPETSDIEGADNLVDLSNSKNQDEVSKEDLSDILEGLDDGSE